MALRLTEVPGGVISMEEWDTEGDVEALADGVRRCLVIYDADRGSAGRGEEAAGEPPFTDAVPWMEDRRLALGDEGAEDAGERWEGGV